MIQSKLVRFFPLFLFSYLTVICQINSTTNSENFDDGVIQFQKYIAQGAINQVVVDSVRGVAFLLIGNPILL